MAWSQRPRAPPHSPGSRRSLQRGSYAQGQPCRDHRSGARGRQRDARIGIGLVVGHPTSDKQSTQVIHLVARTVQEASLDLGEPGDSLGDQFIFSEDLFRDGKKVGHDGGVCTLVRLVPRVSATTQCVVTASLPKGQITVQGLPTFTEGPTSFLLAITGGTGAYKTAHGQVKVVEVSEVESRLTLFLIL